MSTDENKQILNDDITEDPDSWMIPPPPPLTRTGPTLEERQASYLKELLCDIKSILTEEQQTKYCLLFGKHVLGIYDTEAEATLAQDQEFMNLATVLYCPFEFQNPIDKSKDNTK